MASLKTVCALTVMVAAFMAHETSAIPYAEMRDIVAKQNRLPAYGPNAYKLVDLKITPKYAPRSLIEYTIEAKMAETNCPNSNTERLFWCSPIPKGKSFVCVFKIQALQDVYKKTLLYRYACK